MAGLEGTTLGPYQIKGLLGAGGMGQVYHAHDPRLDREVAIKVLAAALAQEQGYLERFRREARAVAQLNHPNIVQVYDFGEQGNLTYLVMPLLTGGTLRDYLAKRGALPVAEAVAIIEQVAAALHYAHERGLVHRDVKPANILLTTDGRALLTDFGIVRLVNKEDTSSTLTATGAFVGSPEFAAPEMVMGQPVDQRVDIYALGITLFQMLTGKMPFSGTTPVSLLVMHTNQPPPSLRAINPAIPPAVEAVVLRSLAKAPEQRYQSVAEFVAALRSASAAQPAAGAPAQPTLSTQARPLPVPQAQPLPVPQAQPLPVPQAQPAAGTYGNLPTLGGPPAPGSGPSVVTSGWSPPGSGPAGWPAPGSGPSGWSAPSGPSATPPPLPTFATNLVASPSQPPVAPTPSKPPRQRRLLPVVLLVLALVLVAGGGATLALGISQGLFKGAASPAAQSSATPRATATLQPSPTATPLPTYYYMAHIFVVMNQDLQNGDTVSQPMGINKNQYLMREGPNGDLYQMGDALDFAVQASVAQVISDSGGTPKFVFLVDRLATYLDAQGYFQHQENLIAGQKTPMNVGEQAVAGMVPTANGQQTYQLFVRDRNVMFIIATVPMGSAQGFNAYFLLVAQAVDMRGESCHYDPMTLKLISGDPNACK